MQGPSISIAKNSNTVESALSGEVDLFIDATGNIKTVDQDGNVKNYGAGVGPSGSDHGALQGLNDDDHAQYHTDARGDARYYTKAQSDSQLANKSDVGHTHVAADITDFSSETNDLIDARAGVDLATLVAGKVPSGQLPSFVDDVLEFADFASLPPVGETGKIYITLDDNKQFRWSGSVYVELVSSPGTTDNVPEGSTNLYFTNLRAQSANASAIAAKQNLTSSLTPIQNMNEDAQLSIGDSNRIGRGLFEKPNLNRWNWFQSDFIQSTLGDLTASQTGTGASTQAGTYGINLTEQCMGVLQSDTGTTSTGRAGIGSASVNHMWNNANQTLFFGARLAVESLSVAGVEQYTLRAGFGNNHTVSGDGTNGAFFRYTDGVNSGRFECVCIKAGVPIAADSGFLADVNYHVFEIEMIDGSVKFFIDGTLVHTETNVLSIPNGPVDTFGFGWKIEKTVGAGQRNLSADWYYVGHVANYTR